MTLTQTACRFATGRLPSPRLRAIASHYGHSAPDPQRLGAREFERSKKSPLRLERARHGAPLSPAAQRVVCLLVGIIVTDTIPRIFPSIEWPTRTRALALVSDLSLNIFLAMSLMSMQLWTLGGLGLALVVVLAAQTIAAVAYIVFVVFPIMGRNYEAAVISAGFTGITLGATPTAIANMTAVTKLHGACARAFIILPLVSAFFIDIANAAAIGLMVR